MERGTPPNQFGNFAVTETPHRPNIHIQHRTTVRNSVSVPQRVPPSNSA
ncbi:hypothetical protein COLO4_14860 [Corchorus olitorius]|uniref:Uncharacterized protein n=1 Tax=Corchorus olitorius TaxID=93759 RepID=A0A1R3JQM2_9ROSI|nr:hypothetical protein COLO4_14860 [Corchorus olitorius]